MANIPQNWPDILQMMEQYTPKLKVTKVLWELPTQGWIKVNYDGASKEIRAGAQLDMHFEMMKAI